MNSRLDGFDKEHFITEIEDILSRQYQADPAGAKPWQLHEALSGAVMGFAAADWKQSARARDGARRACYFSAEFLVGRAVYNNLLCLGLLDEARALLHQMGTELSALEDTEDAALGNGGLGRLAACFLDSAATLSLPVDGYGIRYRYGLFRQTLEGGFQHEYADHWTRYGDPWSVRREDEAVEVCFADQTVRAVPYDMPVFGYGTRNVGTLRLWQAEPLEEFDFALFNDQQYDAALRAKNRAEDISRVLYPNDTGDEGRILRLKQQYFFCSASLQSILRAYKRTHGSELEHFADWYAIQLNDTHPVISIPELIRLLMLEGQTFLQAFAIAQRVFSYTNHTIMAEALEKWGAALMAKVCPQILAIIRMISEHLSRELTGRGIPPAAQGLYRIVEMGTVHMARLGIYAGHCVNGVAELHTEIIKSSALPEWYALFPARFQNKTNGITQRRWLLLCNPRLSALATRLLGGEEWVTDLDRFAALAPYADDHAVLEEFMDIKQENKARLAAYIERHEGVKLDPSFVFDVQIKRLHEYKRQLLNALAILDLYFGIKEGRIRDFVPTAFIFGAKSAPGYMRAKGIIRFICQIGERINRDPAVADKMKVVFVQNYNVSYAEKLICAADISEQISTAGTEASGTSNMKFMLNGTVTLGTYDGANIEIVREAGEENSYIFGARIEELDAIRETYDPTLLYKAEPRIRRALDTLIDGTFDDGGTGEFEELHDSILLGASWHRPDHYFVLHDFLPYVDAKRRLLADTRDAAAFAAKGWRNMAHAGRFSSDRTIREYARDIWNIQPTDLNSVN